jgi:hypothetical protein
VFHSLNEVKGGGTSHPPQPNGRSSKLGIQQESTMHSFIYTQPDGNQQTFNGVTKEDARDQAQLAFFTDYRAGLWQGLRTDGCITEAVAKSETIHIPKDEPQQDDASTMSMDDIDALLDTSAVDDFMDAVCNDDPPVTEQVVDDMASDYEQTNDAMDALSEDMNPVFQGGWGSGSNGVSNHGDKRTVDAVEVSEVAVERQQKHDAWLADLGLSTSYQEHLNHKGWVQARHYCG